MTEWILLMGVLTLAALPPLFIGWLVTITVDEVIGLVLGICVYGYILNLYFWGLSDDGDYEDEDEQGQ